MNGTIIMRRTLITLIGFWCPGPIQVHAGSPWELQHASPFGLEDEHCQAFKRVNHLFDASVATIAAERMLATATGNVGMGNSNSISHYSHRHGGH